MINDLTTLRVQRDLKYRLRKMKDLSRFANLNDVVEFLYKFYNKYGGEHNEKTS
jgi:hypothetical protein